MVVVVADAIHVVAVVAVAVAAAVTVAVVVVVITLSCCCWICCSSLLCLIRLIVGIAVHGQWSCQPAFIEKELLQLSAVTAAVVELSLLPS